MHARHDADVACSSCTGKIIKNGLRVFERGEHLLQNGILHFVFKLSHRQKSCCKARIYTEEKLTFFEIESGLALKGLIPWKSRLYFL